MKKTANVDEYIDAHPEWSELLVKLRAILLATELEETIKWGAPVYTLKGKNLVGIGAFKSYAGLWFFDGALLEDKHHKLINAQEGKTKGMRQWRMQDIVELDEKVLSSYIREAIVLSQSGQSIQRAKPKPLELPEEFAQAFAKDQSLSQQFYQLTPYKQKEFAEYVSSAKREATRQSRLEKCIPLILKGTGLNDKYRNC
ncbi:YdeI/OmpD-associated family protein [Aliikangiella coralliicola]|uniref:YdhG-like domain-containing protein n=1 Tax=Aliikangiella coralliicola TaxID=2592383 RepID=A0A545UEP8_9GAMM|nr:DUF1801 domain-containing protein [Aliikangiella coralliicola]TQV87944.1 hypothetical protein FLL46_11235 [Aliikangiella coralliicola]